MAKSMLKNLTAIAQNTQSDNIRMIDIDELHESPDNFFRIERVEELADTILGQGGIRDNLVVRPLESGGYEIVSGHRRRAAVQLLLERGDNISRFLPCLIRNYENDAMRILDMILLNVSVRQLSDAELWQSYEQLDQTLKEQKEIGVRFGRVRETLAALLGISSSQVSKLQHITSNAEPDIQAAVADGTLSINTANEIAKLEPAQQQQLVQDDLSKVTPKKIKQAANRPAGKKVDTPVNFSDSEDGEPADEKVDTPVNFSDSEDGEPADEKVDTLVNFSDSEDGEPAGKKVDTPVNFSDSEDGETIPETLRTMLGYLTLTLQEMGMNPEIVKRAQKTMCSVFERESAETARAAYEDA